MQPLLERIEQEDPVVLGRTLAAGRIAVGGFVLVLPRAWLALLGDTEPAPATVAVTRMLAGRDVAIGLGGVLAARHGSQALRGWLEAGALADAVDSAALAVGTGVRPSVRAVAALGAAGATGGAVWLARRLGPDPANATA